MPRHLHAVTERTILADHVARIVAEAPPLTPNARELIAALFAADLKLAAA